MEVFDELNEQGQLTGRKVTRDEAHKAGVWHKAVVLFLINGEGQVLLQKRSMEKKNWPGLWDVTSGGHVNAGETGIVAAIRELQEELGVKVSTDSIKFIGKSQSVDTAGNMVNRHFNEYYISKKEVDLGNLQLQKGEVEKAEWINFADLKKMIEQKDNALTPKWDAYSALVRAYYG